MLSFDTEIFNINQDKMYQNVPKANLNNKSK